MLLIVTLAPESEVVLRSVIPPLEAVAQLGTPEATVSTCPALPMPKRVLVFAVADE